jgi:hypothetical protein
VPAGGEEVVAAVVAEQVGERGVGVERLLAAEDDDRQRQPVEYGGVGKRFGLFPLTRRAPRATLSRQGRG